MCMWKKSEWWNERWMGPPIQPKTLNCQIDWNITPKLYTQSMFINKSFAQNIPEGRGSRVQNLVLLEPLEKGQGQEQLVLLGQEAELQGQQSQLSLVYPESQNQQFKSDSWNRVSFIPNMKRKGKNYVLIPHEHRPYLANKMKTLAELVMSNTWLITYGVEIINSPLWVVESCLQCIHYSFPVPAASTHFHKLHNSLLQVGSCHHIWIGLPICITC